MTVSMNSVSIQANGDDELLTGGTNPKTGARRTAGGAIRLASSITPYSASPIAQAVARSQEVLQVSAKCQTCSREKLTSARQDFVAGSSSPDFSLISVPKGMSKVDALEGLWNCSKPASFFEDHPHLLQQQETAAWKDRAQVEASLEDAPRIDYFGGRCIKTDFSAFPDLDLKKYTGQCVNMTPAEVKDKCLKK